LDLAVRESFISPQRSEPGYDPGNQQGDHFSVSSAVALNSSKKTGVPQPVAPVVALPIQGAATPLTEHPPTGGGDGAVNLTDLPPDAAVSLTDMAGGPTVPFSGSAATNGPAARELIRKINPSADTLTTAMISPVRPKYGIRFSLMPLPFFFIVYVSKFSDCMTDVSRVGA
jgi:hypothetical protein